MEPQNEIDKYEQSLIEAIEEMERKRVAGETKNISMIELYKPHQDLYNWQIYKLSEQLERDDKEKES